MLNSQTIAVAASTIACLTNAVSLDEFETAMPRKLSTELAQVSWGWFDDIIEIVAPDPTPAPTHQHKPPGPWLDRGSYY